MKKKYYLFALAFLGLTLTACNNSGGVGLDYDDLDLDIDTPWVDYSVPVTKITFAEGEDSIEINKGETHEYDYSLEPSKAKKSSLSWSSSNERVATVNKGVVTAVAPGETEVTVYNEIESFEPVSLSVKVNSPLEDISFSSESLAADFSHSYDLEDLLLVYTPYDTTEKGVSWSVNCEASIAEIDAESGVLTTKTTEANVVVTARSAYIDKIISLNVEIADRTIYPASVVVDEYQSEIEIGHDFQFTAHAVAEDPTQAVTHPEMKYYSDDSSKLVVEEDTGVVHAVGEGDAHIYAVSSKEGVESQKLLVHVFEVKVANIYLEDITLSNRNGRSDVSVDFTYTTDTPGYEKASIPNFVYSVGDESVATVNANGKLFAVAETGSTTLTVRETRSDKSVTVNLTVCYEVDTVTVTAPSSTVLVGNTARLSVSTSPAGVPASYTSFSSSDESVATVNESGVVTAVSEGTVEITATVLGKTGKITLNVELPDIPFDSSYAYVVGNMNYASGTSKPSVTGSWDKANQAKRVDDKVQDAHDTLLYERRAIVYFHEEDIWKLRSANGSFGSPYGYLEPNGWPEGATYQLGEYKNAGSLSNGDMIVDESNNIEVTREGWYAIYHAQYTNENPLGWYSIYVGRYELNISDTTPKVKVGTSITIEAHDWAGELTYEKTQGTDLISVTRGEGTHSHEFTILAGATPGQAVIKFTDEFKSVDVIVTVTETDPPATTWEDGIPYIVGNADYSTGTATGSGAYWGDHPEKAYKAVASHETPPLGVYAQFEAEITFEQGNEFKVVVGGQALYWDAVYETDNGAFVTTPAQMSKADQQANVVVNDAGKYKIYIKCMENDGGWRVVVQEKEGSEPPVDYEHDYYLVGVGGHTVVPNDYYLTKDAENENHYYITNVTLNAGNEIIAHNPTTHEWKGVASAYQGDLWEVGENGNLKVLVGGSYTVNLYLDGIGGNYLGISPTVQPDPEIPQFTANIRIDPALAEWSPRVYNVSLYVWTNDGSKPLGTWEQCAGNLDNGSVELTYNKAVTHFILYFSQEDVGDWQTVDLTCDLQASGDYIIDISNHSWNDDNKMEGVVIRLDEGGGDTPVTYPEIVLKGDFNNWTPTGDTYVMSTTDGNDYVLTGVEIHAGQGMKGYDTAGGDNAWYGVVEPYAGCGWTVGTGEHDKDCIVSNDGIYTVHVYLDGQNGNHITIQKTGDIPGGGGDDPTTIVTVYFTCPSSWNNLHVYLFKGTTAKTAWPGDGMDYVGQNQYGQAVYSVTFDTSSYDSVIFNNGQDSYQTVDISVSNILAGGNNAVYIVGGQEQSTTAQVGYWKYTA